ncbi:hypothetical protein H5410_010827 [Solanum commersonii]|uniref:Uncharacterized protein n=1 Tax=Solanum commersonii TaxID=4109 RepID=A0A9J6AMJ9_SOLCO|nr:hypothetical protein H5410_010827 [Solanum commersonii]
MKRKKRNDISLENSTSERREEPWKIFQRYLVNGLYFFGENVYNFSKMIIKISLVKIVPHSGKISLKSGKLYYGIILPLISGESYRGPTIKILLNRFSSYTKHGSRFPRISKVISIKNIFEVDFTKEQISFPIGTYYNNFWDKLMKKDLETKSLSGRELLDLITKNHTRIINDSIKEL